MADAIVAVVAEAPGTEDEALTRVAALRRAGIAAEAFVTGSQKKRYDRALKTRPAVTVSLRGEAAPNVRAIDGRIAIERIEGALA